MYRYQYFKYYIFILCHSGLLQQKPDLSIRDFSLFHYLFNVTIFVVITGPFLMMKGVHAFISGKVQGVYFRDHTRKRAQALLITGWVKNLPDGRVEIKAFGAAAALQDFLKGLWKGSPAAEVSEVRWEEVPLENYPAFNIRD